jgi:xanthine dehydrogenase accessory factor
MDILNPTSSIMHQFGQACLQKRAAMVIVDIRELKGSAPRGAGTLMFVAADAVAGTIGGGHLEFAAITHARQLIRDGVKLASEQTFALGPSLGQCCGGSVLLGYEILSDSNWTEIKAKLVSMVNNRFTLNLFGAGHVGAALVKALTPLPCLVNWIDEREELFALANAKESVCASVRIIAVDAPAAEVHTANAGDYYLVLTHSHALDLEIVEAVLQRGDAGYLGLIGSETKRAVFTNRLLQKGLSVAQLHCPVGLPGLQGKEPEVIAASIAADLLMRSSSCSKS